MGELGRVGELVRAPAADSEPAADAEPGPDTTLAAGNARAGKLVLEIGARS